MKRTWSRVGKLLCVFLALLALTAGDAAPFATTAEAVTQEEIDSLQDTAKELANQRQEIKAQLAKLKSDKSKATQRLNLLAQQITVTEQQIATTDSMIGGYEAQLDQTAHELEEYAEEEAKQYELFCQRARAMEEAGEASYWSALFQAADFSDLLSRLSDIQMVIDYNQSVLDELERIQAEIKEKQEFQELKLAETEAARAELKEQQKDLEEQHKEVEDLVAELNANVAEYEEVSKELAAEEDRIQKDIVEKSNQLAIEKGWTASVGGYIWPVSSSRKITSPMGSRNTGIKGASTNHKGVDIGGVGTNTTVVATKAGVVITSAYSSSYGNYVVVSHGPGNTTLYAHMSSRSVKEGDTVSQGDPLGVTGSTGISSGPHLHYEITENGSRVNPLDYLPGYIKCW